MAISDLSFMHAAGDGGPRPRTQVVVIHATDNTASAAGEAGYAMRRPDQTSAHFYVDDTTAIRALPLGHIAYGCLYHGNQISVQLELVGRSNQISDATMRRAAPIVAELCRQYGLPVQKVTGAQVAAGVKGICGHADITAAFPQDGGDHTDPGLSFPWATFIGYVRQSGGIAPSADPTNTADIEEDDMAGGIGPIDIQQAGTGSFNIWPANTGAAGHGPAWINVCNDTNNTGYAVRIWASKGDGNWYALDDKLTLKSGQRYSKALPDATCCLSVTRVPVKPGDPVYGGHLTFCVEYGKRV